MATKDNSMDFEKKLQDLEALVAKLETGELSLEESLKAYEKGVALTRDCQSMLEKAQLRIDMAADSTSLASGKDTSSNEE